MTKSDWTRRQTLAGMGAALTAAMLPVQGMAAGAPRGYLRTNWSRDPFALGSYSYTAKGARKKDRRNIEAPIEGRIFFAGEAAYHKRSSTVHAAHESGLRVASMLRKKGHQKVAVVGAGMSGLTAAKDLSDRGLDVTVFEARDRIGGRLWTDNSLGVPLDLGASWIHGTTGNPLTALSDQQALARVATDDSYILRGRDGREMRDADVADGVLEQVEIQTEAGADLADLNTRAYLLDDDYDGKEVVFPGGYSDILGAFNGDYDLRLSTQVGMITLEDGGVWVTPRAARPEFFDAVLVTVPLGVLKEGSIGFKPELPDAKRRSISRLGMGVLDKVYLQFDRPFWDQDVTWIYTPEAEGPAGQFNVWLNFYKTHGVPIIMAFNGGSAARSLANKSDREIIAQASKAIRSAYSL
ncbi:FAD-dependent oxidoreductase [Cognatishimia sp.]|uniref:flavin monoamine oxidase family protein n=1 Tax=Cognatishimia sp. TaxID=2211648 RepID=UPI003514C630